MENPNERALAQLQADWPHWQVWIVYKVIGGPTWCARRRDDHKKVINADSAGNLAEYLEDEVSEPLESIPRLDMAAAGDLLRDLYPDWIIGRDPGLGVWTAERADGTSIHFLAATEAWELSIKIRQAEQ